MDLEILDADVLCVGGGPAGLMAGIRAAELGAKVIVAEKGNTVRSGSAATGCDHFRCYMPEIHGPDIKPIVEVVAKTEIGAMKHHDFIRTWLEKSFDIVKLWDSWGIPMKYQGKYEFAGHVVPGAPRTSLHYSGREQKPILTAETLKRGARILNRVMVFDLSREGETFIATGIDTREDKILVIRATSVVLGTGLCTMLYPSPTPGWIFNKAYSPSNTGDGRSMAYRVGAKLVNLELTMRWSGLKYLSRCGKGTWVGVLRDPEDKPVGSVAKPDRRYGDRAADTAPTFFEEQAKSGRGPIYMDCRGISNEDYEYMMYFLEQEGNLALLNHMSREGIDFRRNPIEFMTYEMLLSGGIYFNEKAETSVKGLYAAGDERFGAISSAATFGWIAGENAATYAKTVERVTTEKVKETANEKQALITGMRSRTTGASWKEALLGLQQIMHDYAGTVRSKSMLEAGLGYLRRFKEQARSSMMAENQHELKHCLEVMNLLDLGELVFIAANERKETRARHVRADYSQADPSMDKLLLVKTSDGKPATEWEEIRR